LEKGLPTSLELHDCETVLRAALKPFARRLGRELEEDAFKELQGAGSESHMLVAVKDSKICGVAICSVEKDTWVIEQVAVNPGDQGRGIGSALLQRIERDASIAGARMLELDTAEIMTDLPRLYHRHGYSAARKGLPKHGRDQFTRVYMQKAI